MAFNVVATDEGCNGLMELVSGFLDLQPVKTIEAFLLEAGSLTYPTNMWPLKVSSGTNSSKFLVVNSSGR